MVLIGNSLWWRRKICFIETRITSEKLFPVPTKPTANNNGNKKINVFKNSFWEVLHIEGTKNTKFHRE
jgi:hypothetical protein